MLAKETFKRRFFSDFRFFSPLFLLLRLFGTGRQPLVRWTRNLFEHVHPYQFFLQRFLSDCTNLIDSSSSSNGHSEIVRFTTLVCMCRMRFPFILFYQRHMRVRIDKKWIKTKQFQTVSYEWVVKFYNHAFWFSTPKLVSDPRKRISCVSSFDGLVRNVAELFGFFPRMKWSMGA